MLQYALDKILKELCHKRCSLASTCPPPQLDAVISAN